VKSVDFIYSPEFFFMAGTSPYITVIAIGDELLAGNTVDSNSHFLSQLLLACGYSLRSVVIVGDEVAEIVRVVRNALLRSDIIIVTGGLGPTPDDITRFAIAEALSRELVSFQKERERIHQRLHYASKKIRIMSAIEAVLPKGAKPIHNSVGLAPGFRIASGEATLFCIPGVPREAQAMLKKNILPFIQKKFPADKTIHHVLKTIGIGESKVYLKIRPFLSTHVSIGFYPRGREVELRIHIPIKYQRAGERAYAQIKKALAGFIYAEDQQTLEEVISSTLRKKKITFATAESCTGGLISKRITDIPGSSSFFKGGIIAYSNAIKKDLLAVKPKTLSAYGAVSPSVARQMVCGLSCLFNVDLALSVTGIAGPTGGTKTKPLGLVYIGIKYQDTVTVKKHIFRGDRQQVRWLTSQAALQLLWQTVC
jgi:nicotinamide-nucleotide amidase